jgi:DnaJ-class molecular chaperone
MFEGAWIIYLVAGVVVLVLYVGSIIFHPYTQCRTCKGRGKHAGMVWAYGRRNCHACGGKGWQRRLGARVMNRGVKVVRQARRAPKGR